MPDGAVKNSDERPDTLFKLNYLQHLQYLDMCSSID